MKRLILAATISSCMLCSCGNTEKKETQADETAKTTMVLTNAADWEKVYRRIEPTAIPGNPIELIGKQWMLITSGDAESYNTMTASWGALGEIWSRPVAIITVRNVRYTNQFLEKNDTFTLSFYDEQYRDALTILGTKSGRDTDKVAESGLTPVTTPSGSMSFGQARMVLECKKLYADPLDRENMAPEITAQYAGQDNEHHIIYIAEITAAWVR